MTEASDDRLHVGGESVFVVPVGPYCRLDFVADTIDSIRFFAPKARIIVIDDSRRGLGFELGERYELTVLMARAHGTHGELYVNLSDGFREALTQPFRILVRLDTDGLITGSDFEAKAIECFDSDAHLGSLGSFRIGYNRSGIRNHRWAKQRFLIYFGFRSWMRPRYAIANARVLLRAHRRGYKLGDSIMGGAAIYRFESIVALNENDLLGRADLASIGLQEDYLFGLCLMSIGYQLGEFGNKFDELPMGVDWRSLPASPGELMRLGKSIVHSTKRFEDMDEDAIRKEFRAARQV
jgi:hypothetical protein